MQISHSIFNQLRSRRIIIHVSSLVKSHAITFTENLNNSGYFSVKNHLSGFIHSFIASLKVIHCFSIASVRMQYCTLGFTYAKRLRASSFEISLSV